MEFEATFTDALTGKPGALDALTPHPTSQWMTHAAAVREALSKSLELTRDWQRLAALHAVVRLRAGREFVRLLLEPQSAHHALGLALARHVGPDDELEERLKELQDTDTLRFVDGADTVDHLTYWMGKAFTSDDVLESMRPALTELSGLAPRQLGRFAPRLVEAIRNWNSVAGLGSDETALVYQALQRANLSTLIAAFEPLVAKDRERWLKTLDDLYFQWPSGASWAENVLEYFKPSEDEESFEPEEPPSAPQVFRRQK